MTPILSIFAVLKTGANQPILGVFLEEKQAKLIASKLLGGFVEEIKIFRSGEELVGYLPTERIVT